MTKRVIAASIYAFCKPFIGDSANPTNQEVMEAFAELKNVVESKSAETAEGKEKLEKLNATLDAHEVKNQELVAKLEKQKKHDDEVKERIHELELQLARSAPGKGKNWKESGEYKALENWVRLGGEITAEEKQLLRTDSNTEGGYLTAPPEMDSQITKKIEEISNIRAISRVRTISGKTLDVPIRKTIPVATYEGEAEAGGKSTSTYQSEQVTPFRQTFTNPITMDMLQDGAFDMESEIMQDSAEAFAKGEGRAHVLGTGHKEPEGFLVNAEILANVRTSQTNDVLEADDLILLTGDLKVGYDPNYVFNRRTLATIRTFKSTTGMFLWQPGLNGPVANTINGFPYVLANDMPDIADGTLPVAFGDFRRGYLIIDRTGMQVIRDNVTRKQEAIIEFTMNRWNTAQVVLAEAIKVLKIQ